MRTRTSCAECGTPREGPEPFVGPRCRPCHNARRRHRYRYDMDYRERTLASKRKAYDKEKHRAYMRDYRARQKTQAEGVDPADTMKAVHPERGEA